MCIIHKSWAKRSGKKEENLILTRMCAVCFCVFRNGQLYYACIIFPFSFYSYCLLPFHLHSNTKTRIEGKQVWFVGKFSYFSIEPKNIIFLLLYYYYYCYDDDDGGWWGCWWLKILNIHLQLECYGVSVNQHPIFLYVDFLFIINFIFKIFKAQFIRKIWFKNF